MAFSLSSISFVDAHLAGSGKQLHLHQAAGESVGLEIAGQREFVARIHTFRSLEIHHPRVDRLTIAPESHGEHRNPGCLCHLGGHVAVDARVAATVGRHHDAGQRTTPFLVHDRKDRITQPGLRAPRQECLLPRDIIRLERGGGRTVGGACGARPGQLDVHLRVEVRLRESHDRLPGEIG